MEFINQTTWNCYYIHGHSGERDVCVDDNDNTFIVPKNVELRFLTPPGFCSEATTSKKDMEATVYSMMSYVPQRNNILNIIYDGNQHHSCKNYNITFNKKEVDREFYGVFNAYFQNGQPLQWELNNKLSYSQDPTKKSIGRCLSTIVNRLSKIHNKTNPNQKCIIIINCCRGGEETDYPFDHSIYSNYLKQISNVNDDNKMEVDEYGGGKKRKSTNKRSRKQHKRSRTKRISKN